MKQLYTQRTVNEADDSVLIVTESGKLVGNVTAKEVIDSLRKNGKQVVIKSFGFDRAHVEQFIKTWFSEEYHPTYFSDDMKALRECYA
jgi:hypothetical protein